MSPNQLKVIKINNLIDDYKQGKQTKEVTEKAVSELLGGRWSLEPDGHGDIMLKEMK